jgi:hypothetical protein
LNDDGTLKCANGLNIPELEIDPKILGGVDLGGAALVGAVALGGGEGSTLGGGEEFVFAGGMAKDKDSDFQYAGSIQKDPVKDPVKENIERIKKML